MALRALQTVTFCCSERWRGSSGLYGVDGLNKSRGGGFLVSLPANESSFRPKLAEALGFGRQVFAMENVCKWHAYCRCCSDASSGCLWAIIMNLQRVEVDTQVFTVMCGMVLAYKQVGGWLRFHSVSICSPLFWWKSSTPAEALSGLAHFRLRCATE